MKEHQKEYIKLINERFGISGKPRKATYKRRRNTIDSGIVVELNYDSFSPNLVFISDNPRNYFHKWAMELASYHLPLCVWITRYSDTALDIIEGFYI